jgi:tetratricopeptide (TPR) repeat protein
MRYLLAATIGCALLYGCANPVNRHTANRYWDAAIAARDAGDWRLARSNFARAIPNAELGGADSRQLAVAYYEYGRSSGVICEWSEAARGLQKALELDRSVAGPIHLSLVELGRMHFDKKEFELAREYFAEAYGLLEEMSAETHDPLGYAQFLVEYATSLERSGAADQATPLRARAEQLRATFPSGKSRTDRTPYGTRCNVP